jgi:hypothetical protein
MAASGFVVPLGLPPRRPLARAAFAFVSLVRDPRMPITRLTNSASFSLLIIQLYHITERTENNLQKTLLNPLQ